MSTVIRECILNSIWDERYNQNAKWGEQNRSTVEWLTILAEEFGEAATEANEVWFRAKSTDALKDELVQTAAVCVAFIESLERGKMQIRQSPEEA